jgi:hypothetical protein
MVSQCILVYHDGSVGNHQSIWIYDYGYDYDQMFWSHIQLRYILQLCMTPECTILKRRGEQYFCCADGAHMM